jgi:hypothetical protein
MVDFWYCPGRGLMDLSCREADARDRPLGVATSRWIAIVRGAP